MANGVKRACMNIKICVPIVGRTAKECVRMLEQAKESGVDLVELRMDFLQEKEKALEVIKASELPVIATLRPAWEGGWFKGGEKQRQQLLIEAAEAADYVDVELDSKIIGGVKNAVKRSGAKLIVSKHGFIRTPSQKILSSTIEREIKAGADICKLVCTATAFEDNTRILQLVSSVSRKTDMVAFCMGELGVTSRILSPLFGACFAFACLEYGRESASGQVSVEDMRGIYKVILRLPQKPRFVA